MMWDRLREHAFHHRGYRGFNTLDRISIATTGLGGIVLLASFLFDADGMAGVGFLLLIVGLLSLLRAFPGEGG